MQVIQRSGKCMEAFTPIWGASEHREQGEYSDSEDDEAPRYEPVYNHTKKKRGKNKETKELINNYADSFEEVTKERLQEDARCIHDVIPKDSRSYGAITILCVALGDKAGRIKKFVCCNCKEVLGIDLRNKAYELGYHVIRAQQAHAEGALMQFLQARPQRYLYVVAMGCDKDHCIECDWMMKAYLCPDYLQVSGEIVVKDKRKRFSKWYIPEALQNIIKQRYTPFSKVEEREKRHLKKAK